MALAYGFQGFSDLGKLEVVHTFTYYTAMGEAYFPKHQVQLAVQGLGGLV